MLVVLFYANALLLYDSLIVTVHFFKFINNKKEAKITGLFFCLYDHSTKLLQLYHRQKSHQLF